MLGNDKSALNALAFADILPRRFVEKLEVFKSTKIPIVTYLISDRLATIKWVLSKLVILNKSNYKFIHRKTITFFSDVYII